MSPQFKYIGHSGEHVVGLDTSDLTADQYDLLSDNLKQAVYINRGSDGGALYAETGPDNENPGIEPVVESAIAGAIIVGDPATDDLIAEAPASVEILDASAPPAEPAPDLDQPLDAPAEGAN